MNVLNRHKKRRKKATTDTFCRNPKLRSHSKIYSGLRSGAPETLFVPKSTDPQHPVFLIIYLLQSTNILPQDYSHCCSTELGQWNYFPFTWTAKLLLYPQEGSFFQWSYSAPSSEQGQELDSPSTGTKDTSIPMKPHNTGTSTLDWK